MLSIFYGALGIFGFDKAHEVKTEIADLERELGVLGYYIVDETKSYGMFIQLMGSLVFIDLKEDDCLAKREEYAIKLFNETKLLEEHLNEFLEKHSDFKAKEIDSIGLHSKDEFIGEVFWTPSGYTKLERFNFTLE